MFEKTTDSKPRRGIYLLPNLFTTGCLFMGFFAIVGAMGQRFEAAAVAIFIAMIMDSLDGRVARLTNTESDFGAQYDSLADMVSFGLAPSLVMYEWSLSSLGKLGWLAAFIFTAGAALRLARFNTQVGTTGKRYFQGLPSPAAAALLAGMVWVGTDYELAGIGLRFPAFVVTLLAGVLMVSNIRYRSFKDLDLKGKVPFVAILVVVLVFVFISIDPPQVLFGIFLAYGISGPAITLITLRKRKAERLQQQNQGQGESDDSPEEMAPDDDHEVKAPDTEIAEQERPDAKPE